MVTWLESLLNRSNYRDRSLTWACGRDEVKGIMKRMGLTLTTVLAVASLGLLGCQRAGSDELSEKLDQIDERLASIEKKIGNIKPGAARGQQRARPPGPDPKKVYAAPIVGAPYKGPEHAKVTIVEAMEYA